MVLLTMTPSIVEGLGRRPRTTIPSSQNDQTSPSPDTDAREPSLENPAVGNPVSHGQVVQLWKELKSHGADRVQFSLENLLKGARIYVPPPPPKPEPSAEYKALMDRLRRDEEERQYQRMINPPPPTETFSQRFPSSATGMAHGFAEVNRPSRASDLGDDDVTYNDVHRQFMLVLNFLVTIFGSAATLWILARWWSTPARLFLTMGGALVIAIAEVGLYSAYIWHLSDAKQKDNKTREVKEVVQTWVVGAGEDEKEPTMIKTGSGKTSSGAAAAQEENGMRKRKKEPS